MDAHINMHIHMHIHSKGGIASPIFRRVVENPRRRVGQLVGSGQDPLQEQVGQSAGSVRSRERCSGSDTGRYSAPYAADVLLCVPQPFIWLETVF